jgi:magnesium transporter
MTLGELKNARTRMLVVKEAWLGLLNGTLVGLTAGGAMLAYAHWQGLPAAPTLALVVAVAMAGSCVAAGVSGVVVPLVLRRLGADPAAASSIFVTTATDCVSMGALLALATKMLP